MESDQFYEASSVFVEDDGNLSDGSFHSLGNELDQLNLKDSPKVPQEDFSKDTYLLTTENSHHSFILPSNSDSEEHVESNTTDSVSPTSESNYKNPENYFDSGNDFSFSKNNEATFLDSNMISDERIYETSENLQEESEEMQPNIFSLEYVKANDEKIELKIKDRDTSLSQQEIDERKAVAINIKKLGNRLFAEQNFQESIEDYNKALAECPLSATEDRAMIYHNRGLAYSKKEEKKLAVYCLSKAVELHPDYLKAYVRRAGIAEELDDLDQAMGDYKEILRIDPGHLLAKQNIARLLPLIEERNEKLKEEMMGKLKDLGNMVLRPFGLSTSNFQMQQDPTSGGYNIKFNQNP